jgi:hypothetical protein
MIIKLDFRKAFDSIPGPLFSKSYASVVSLKNSANGSKKSYPPGK